MGQVIATGKWSKQLKRWFMVIAIRRPAKESSGSRETGRRPPHSTK
jgi:hypothetical protein